jgi:uncharacterized membrane protein YgdD (TMEM256/DUF423 family)
MKNPRFWLRTAALLGALGVGMGAFGAHALEALLSEYGRTATYETAVSYHLYHSLALLALAVWYTLQAGQHLLRWPALCFSLGILIFSGSLYILCLTNTPWLGAITPIGGVFFITGWLLLLRQAAAQKKALP